jgi:competence protein ComEA
MRTTRLWKTSLAAIAAILLVVSAPADAKAKESAKASAASRVDLNSASQADLEALPGVGAATAKKIVAGRPYSSVADLSKAGVSAKTIEKITPLVTVGKSSASSPAAASAPMAKPAKSGKSTPAAAVPAGPVDLNSASQKELETLPAVGAAMARKIIAGRPYSSVSELSKAGVSAKTIETITPLVTAGGVRPAALQPPFTTTSAAPMEKPEKVKQRPRPPRSWRRRRTFRLRHPAPGMVWVNTATKVFHREGDPWYGKTKQGKFMTESDALKAGYRASKQGAPKK